MSIYINHPLPRGQAYIRLLQIVQGSATNDIKCEFSTFDIDAAPRYQALSYEWGPKSPSKLIYIMNQPKEVRLNLWNFLSRLRSLNYHDYLWCDAICIDQGNDYERNHQVQLMRQIYRKALSVLVWLGEEHHSSSSTLLTIHTISKCADSAARAAYLTERETVWKGLVNISRRRYWTRIWIVQEITVAQDIEVFCGTEMVPWSAFATACKFPPDQLMPWASDLWAPLVEGDSEQHIRRSAGRELYHSTMYGLIRSQRRWPTYVESFKTLSERYQDSGCEDIRDRVFALLGIAKEVALERGFTVDYQRDIEETFIALIAWGGTGPIAIYSLIHFALLTAKVMNLEWPDYLSESMIEFEFQRSTSFSKWVHQPLTMAIQCRYLGKWAFSKSNDTVKVEKPEMSSKYDNIGMAEISPQVFENEPVVACLPFDAVEHFKQLAFDLFGFETSKVLLVCKATRNRSWIVVTRAFFQWNADEPLPNRCFVPTVFEGLEVVANQSAGYRIELKNVAQFMEIFLDKLSPYVWRQDKGSGVGLRGAGSLAKAKKNENRNLEQVLEGLKIKNLLAMTAKGEQRNPEENDEGESFEADFDKLLAETEVFAKPHVPRPPVEMPRRW